MSLGNPAPVGYLIGALLLAVAAVLVVALLLLRQRRAAFWEVRDSSEWHRARTRHPSTRRPSDAGVVRIPRQRTGGHDG